MRALPPGARPGASTERISGLAYEGECGQSAAALQVHLYYTIYVQRLSFECAHLIHYIYTTTITRRRREYPREPARDQGPAAASPRRRRRGEVHFGAGG